VDFEKIASTLVENWINSQESTGMLRQEAQQALWTAITTALRAAATVPKGMVRVGTEDHRLDLTGWSCEDPERAVPLPVFADGEMWIQHEEFYTIGEDGHIHEFFSFEHGISWTSSGWVVRWGDGEIELSKCYSSQSAAQAARERGAVQ
jgi:hypothetical protein